MSLNCSLHFLQELHVPTEGERRKRLLDASNECAAEKHSIDEDCVELSRLLKIQYDIGRLSRISKCACHDCYPILRRLLYKSFENMSSVDLSANPIRTYDGTNSFDYVSSTINDIHNNKKKRAYWERDFITVDLMFNIVIVSLYEGRMQYAKEYLEKAVKLSQETNKNIVKCLVYLMTAWFNIVRCNVKVAACNMNFAAIVLLDLKNRSDAKKKRPLPMCDLAVLQNVHEKCDRICLWETCIEHATRTLCEIMVRFVWTAIANLYRGAWNKTDSSNPVVIFANAVHDMIKTCNDALECLVSSSISRFRSNMRVARTICQKHNDDPIGALYFTLFACYEACSGNFKMSLCYIGMSLDQMSLTLSTHAPDRDVDSLQGIVDNVY